MHWDQYSAFSHVWKKWGQYKTRHEALYININKRTNWTYDEVM
jgi:hypothetical protein